MRQHRGPSALPGAMCAVIVTLAACSERRATILFPAGPKFVDAIEIEWPNIDGSMDIVEEEAVAGTFPEWHGENPALDVLPAGQQYTCPNAAVSVMLIASDRGTFVISGAFIKQQDNNYTHHGYPTARYTLPSGAHYNLEGNYFIQGGFVEVECRGRFFVIGASRVWVGDLHPYSYSGGGGPADSHPGGGSGAVDQGWAYKNAENYRNGSAGSGDWVSVLDAYIYGGVCTPGRSIIVDGAKACDG